MIKRLGISQWFDAKTGEPVSPERHAEIDESMNRILRHRMQKLMADIEPQIEEDKK